MFYTSLATGASFVRKMKFFLFIIYLFLLTQVSLTAQDRFSAIERQQLESYIDQLLTATGVVPGLGLAIVAGDAVIYQRGFGLRDVERQLPVTPETGFYIASVTKSITGMAAARLEAAGIVDLSANLASYFPGQDFDPGIQAEGLSLLDLLTHNHTLDNSGLQYHLAYIGELSPAAFDRIVLDFSTPRPKGFEYSNTSYNIVAGVMEKVTGQSWKETNAAQVLGPAGMHHTTAFISRALQRPFAYPYHRTPAGFDRLPLKADAQMQSAGGYISTPVDLARWLLLHINGGQLEGRQLVPRAVMDRIHRPWARQERRFFNIDRYAYGIGWQHGLYEGDTLIHHFGGFDGYSAHVSFMPEHRLGVVALTNESNYAAAVPHMVAAYIYDMLLGKPNVYEKYVGQIEKVAADVQQSRAIWRKRLAGKADRLSSAAGQPQATAAIRRALPGVYHNPRIGEIKVYEFPTGELMAGWGPHTAPLIAVAADTFLVDWMTFEPPTELTISYAPAGEAVALHYGHREFRRRPEHISPEQVETHYTELRRAWQQLAGLTAGERTGAVQATLEKYYPTGLITEPYLNTFGYRYLRAGDTSTAIAFFQFATERYPTSANAYDSLGEAYLQAGKRDLARLMYTKSLALDPKNENARRILAELK